MEFALTPWRALCVCLRGDPYCWYEIFKVQQPVGYVFIVEVRGLFF